MNLLNVFILSFGALQGVLLSILLLRKKVFRTANFYLLLYLLALLLQAALKIASKVWLMQHIPVVYGLSYHLPFLYGPLLYLFVAKTIPAREAVLFRKGKIRSILRAPAWHFLPFLLIVSMGMQGRNPFPASAIFYAQLLSLSAYHGYVYVLLLREKKAAHKTKVELHRWLRQHALISWLVTGSVAIGLYLIYLYYPRHAETRFLFATITLYIYWFSYEAMRGPGMFYAMPDEAPKESPQSPEKYGNSTLSTAETEMLLARLQRVMREQRPYLNPELTMDSLAGLIGSSRHHLSQAINGSLQKNFYEYLNEYRVSAAMQLLSDPAVMHLKIAAIAYDTGFNSLSTFNEAFKKMTGQTPSGYRKRIPALSVR